MKHIFTYLLLLFCSSSLLAQSGLGYLNYRAFRTQYGNNSNWTYNGVTYNAYVGSSDEFDGMFDATNPANTLLGEGVVLANSSQGLAGGHPPYTNGQVGAVGGEYFAVEYTGWFYADLGGQYLFYTYADDDSEVWVGGTKVAAKYGGSGTASGWITLTAGTWYTYKYRYHEQGGGDYGYQQVYGPKNGYYYPGGASDVYQVSNQAPVYPHKLQVTYNLNSNLNKTKFNSSVVLTDLGTASTAKPLSSSGIVNFQEGDGLDNTLYSSGNSKVTLVANSVEFCVIYSYDTTNKRYRVGLDSRLWTGTTNAPQWDKVTQLKIFDLWDGVVTPASGSTATDVHWNEYYVYTDTQFDWANSTYASYIRTGNGYYALKLAGNFTFEDITGFTTHKVRLDMDETYFTTTYPDMITIADVAKGFSQLTNQTDSPNGPQGGVFTSDVEFMLGDVNGDNTFDFLDTQMLLQHLFAETSPFSTKTIDNSLLMFDGGYTNSITSNWSSNKPTTRLFTHTLDENNKEKTKSIDVAFIGDLNFSHSSTLQSVNVTAKTSPMVMFSKTESNNVMILDVIKEGDILKVTLEIPQNQNNISGTQFKLNYDEGRLEYVDSQFSTQSISSFTSKRSGYINIGSFSSDGSYTVNSGITYTLNFKLKSSLDSTLGLVSLGFSELVNKDGNQVIYIVK